MRRSKERSRFIFLCVAPATILFFIFMVLPTLNVFRMSLFERGAYSPTETFVGMSNFRALIRDAKFIASMQNTILLIVTVTVITFFLRHCLCGDSDPGENQGAELFQSRVLYAEPDWRHSAWFYLAVYFQPCADHAADFPGKVHAWR